MNKRVTIGSDGLVYVDDVSLGVVSQVGTGDGGHVYEAVGHDGTTVRRFSPGGAAHALRDLMIGAPE